MYNIICDLEEDGDCICNQPSSAKERLQVILKHILTEWVFLNSNKCRVCAFAFTTKVKAIE